MKRCAYTIVDDNYFYPCGTHIFVNTFKKFHPDIDLVVYRQDMIDKVMQNGVNFYNAKPVFAKLLTDKYDMIVNCDADTVVMDRLTEVFDSEWEVGAVLNFNAEENTSVANITEEMYVQAGLVGSTNPKFWDIWQEANRDAMNYKCKENDILNLVWYNNPIVNKMNRVIWDKDKNYLGCKSLGRESEFYMEGKKVMLAGEQVKAYHHAHGAIFPKLDFDNMPFTFFVKEYLKSISKYGTTVTYG